MALEAFPNGGNPSRADIDEWAARVLPALEAMDRASLVDALVELEASRSLAHDYAKGLIRALMMMIDRRLDAAEKAAPKSRSVKTRAAMLHALAMKPVGYRPAELAGVVGATGEYVNRLLQRLVAEELVAKASDPGGDGRAVVYSLTESGFSAALNAQRDLRDTPANASELSAALQRSAEAVLRTHREARRLERPDGRLPARPERVMASARRLGLPRLYWEALGELITTYRHSGDVEGARTAMSRFDGVVPDCDSDRQDCGLRDGWKAYQSAKLGDPLRRVDLLREAWEKSTQSAPSELGVWVAHSLAVEVYRSGFVRPAYYFAQDAFGQATKMDDRFAAVTTGVRLALLQKIAGESDLAINTLNALVETSRTENYRTLLGECLLQRGDSRRCTSPDSLDAAVRDLEEAESLLDPERAARQYAFAVSALGAAHYDARRFDIARRWFDRALQVAVGPELTDVRALTRRRLAVLNVATDEDAPAAECARLALADYQGLSRVGELESLACLLPVADNKIDVVQQMGDILRQLVHFGQKKVLGELPPEKVLAVSRWHAVGDWFLPKVESEVAQVSRKPLSDVKRGWQRLQRLGIVSKPNATVSSMGKEPAKVRLLAAVA